MMVDHGILSILPLLTDTRWPAPIVPIAANVIQHPIPTPRRFFRLGQAIRRAIESYPQDLRVARAWRRAACRISSTGRTSASSIRDWDNEFMDRLERDPESLTRLTHHDYMERGGAESVEIIMWLAMRAALGAEGAPRPPQLLRADADRATASSCSRARTAERRSSTGSGTWAFEPARQYLESLRDDRQIWIDGERVTDVTTDRRFAAAAHTMAELYDMQHDPALLERHDLSRRRPAASGSGSPSSSRARSTISCAGARW